MTALTMDVPTGAAMHALGERLGAMLRAGDLVLLTGDLGAGKTTLTQGVAAGLGVRGPVTSPTFVLARVHPPLMTGGVPLVHVDAYRLASWDELEDLDLETTLDDAVTVVEWGTGLAEGLADDRLEVRIERPPDAAELTNRPTAPPTSGRVPLDERNGSEGVRRVAVRGLGRRWATTDLTRLAAVPAG